MHKTEDMAATKIRKVLDVFGEHVDGFMVYKCTIDQKTKLAKYIGMRFWLKEQDEEGLLKMLDGIHWLLVEEGHKKTKVSL